MCCLWVGRLWNLGLLYLADSVHIARCLASLGSCLLHSTGDLRNACRPHYWIPSREAKASLGHDLGAVRVYDRHGLDSDIAATPDLLGTDLRYNALCSLGHGHVIPCGNAGHIECCRQGSSGNCCIVGHDNSMFNLSSFVMSSLLTLA